MVPAVQLPMEELVRIIEQANILKIMATERTRSVTVDYVPAREAMSIVREEDDSPLELFPQRPIAVTFQLEDAMFGGDIYVALTCGNRVVINPFRWSSFDALAKITLTSRKG